MKKSMILAALMCCFVSATAQQTYDEPEVLRIHRMNRNDNSYIVKLDSVTTGWSRCLYEYDARLNCTRQTEYRVGTIGWYVCSTREYTYDDLDRVTSIRSNNGGGVNKTEYTYNEQGLLSKAIQFYYNGTNWHFETKYNYVYDGEGNQTLFLKYKFKDGSWIEEEKKVWEYVDGLPQTMVRYLVGYAFEKTFYSYNAQGYCNEMTRCYRNTEPGSTVEWGAYYKEVYEYDDAGNLLSRVSLRLSTNSQEWYYSEKTELAYDGNNNCTNISEYSGYDNNTGQWLYLNKEFGFVYDSTVNINNIAGLSSFWKEYFDLDIPLFNELQLVTIDMGDVIQYDFYYSNSTGLDEPTDGVFAVYPNPATGVLFVETHGRGSLPDQTYHITNLMGQTVQTGSLNGETQQIDVSGLPQGMYFIILGEGTRKFVVEK